MHIYAAHFQWQWHIYVFTEKIEEGRLCKTTEVFLAAKSDLFLLPPVLQLVSEIFGGFRIW